VKLAVGGFETSFAPHPPSSGAASSVGHAPQASPAASVTGTSPQVSFALDIGATYFIVLLLTILETSVFPPH